MINKPQLSHYQSKRNFVDKAKNKIFVILVIAQTFLPIATQAQISGEKTKIGFSTITNKQYVAISQRTFVTWLKDHNITTEHPELIQIETDPNNPTDPSRYPYRIFIDKAGNKYYRIARDRPSKRGYSNDSKTTSSEEKSANTTIDKSLDNLTYEDIKDIPYTTDDDRVKNILKKAKIEFTMFGVGQDRFTNNESGNGGFITSGLSIDINHKMRELVPQQTSIAYKTLYDKINNNIRPAVKTSDQVSIGIEITRYIKEVLDFKSDEIYAFFKSLEKKDFSTYMLKKYGLDTQKDSDRAKIFTHIKDHIASLATRANERKGTKDAFDTYKFPELLERILKQANITYFSADTESFGFSYGIKKEGEEKKGPTPEQSKSDSNTYIFEEPK